MRAIVHGTFFACPHDCCNGVCRNGYPVQQGHFVCEKCFSRFRVVGHDEVEEVETVEVSPRTLGAIEMLAAHGMMYMQQANVDFHDAASKLNSVYHDVYSSRWRNNKRAYDALSDRSKDVLLPMEDK